MKRDAQLEFVERSESRIARRILDRETDYSARSRGQREYPLLHVTELMLPPLRARIGLLSCGWAVFFLTLLAAQTVRSQLPEYSVLEPLAGDQDFPSICIRTEGGYLTWEDNRSGGKTSPGVLAVALNSDFTSTGSVFRVNGSVGSAGKPKVQVLSNGNILFVWEVRSGTKAGVYSRLLGKDGKFLTTETLVSQIGETSTTRKAVEWFGFYRNIWKSRKFAFREKLVRLRDQSGNASIGALGEGNAVVVYQAGCRTETNSYVLERQIATQGIKTTTNDVLKAVRQFGGTMQDIFLQRLDSQGKKIGTEVVVNQYTDFNQRSPAVSVLSDGRFVVVWVCESPVVESSPVENLRIDVRARIFDGNAQPVSDEIVVTGGEDVLPANPSVSMNSSGGFSVFWSQQESLPSRRWDVFGREFGSAGVAAGGAFRINDHTAGDQFAPQVASVGGNQMVVWTSVGQDGSKEGIYGRVLAGSQFAGDEFRVNSTTISRQYHPAVSAAEDGRALAVWASFVGDLGIDIFGSTIEVGGETGSTNP